MPSTASPHLPLLILLLASACIVASYVLTFRSGVLVPLGGRLVTPPISLLMFNGPGRIIGQLGFPAVSLLFASLVPSLRRGLYMALEGHPGHELSVGIGIVSACISFAGLAVVGALPLQPDIVMVMIGRAALSTDSIVHQSAAGVFFLGAIVHVRSHR